VGCDAVYVIVQVYKIYIETHYFLLLFRIVTLSVPIIGLECGERKFIRIVGTLLPKYTLSRWLTCNIVPYILYAL